MINIKDTANNIRFSTEINTGSKRKFTLMNEDYIILKFSVEEPIYFKLGDYADTELGLFELVDPYKPTLNESTGGYDYELRLDAYYWKWKNKMFRFNPEVGGSEASWKLTSTLDVHLGVFLRNLTALGYTYKGTPFEIKIDSTVSNTSKLVIYENINLIDALSQMAETWECEWWVEDNQICFGRCEFGDPVDFEIFENVENMTREESKTTYATRVYAFGSTRNIPHDYRPVDESVVVNGIVQKRLMMPVGVPYVDAYPDMTTEEAIEDVVVFEDIYPRRTGTMSSVTPVEKPEEIENPDGTTTESTYTAYQFKDTGITFSKDYILPGEELRIVFQTGAMAGMDFAVRFNPKDDPEKLEDGSWNPEAQLWEIIRNEDYGRMLPADTLIPKDGDTYNLYGFDSTSEVFKDMVSRAEEELEEAAKKYVEKTKIDPNTYPCTMMSDYMYNDGNVRTNEFTVGARINLINPAYFENGRVSRVIGFEFDLDIPYSSPVFTIGETAGYSRIGDLEEKVDELTYKGQTFTGTGSGVYVIGTNDNTSPTNKNVYSALKVLREFVRYQGWVDQPVRQQDDVRFKSVTSPLFVFNELTTPEFVSGLLGSGTRLKDNHLELDEITVRKRMNVFELLIQRVRAVGGQLLLSPASIKIESVEELEDGYKCSFNTDEQTIPEPFVLNDQGFHQTFTGKGINRYWRLVTGVGSDYFILSKTDREEGSGIPRAGDEIILLGNRTDKARQSAMMLSAYGSDAPYLDTYDGIDSYDLSGKLLTREGNLTGIVDDVFGQLSGSGFYGKNVFLRGRFAFNSGQDVEEVLEEVKITANEARDYITNTLPALFEEVDARIDGQVESFFENYDPTLTNKPASDWTTGIEKERHLNDTFTNNTTGASWKWVKDGNAYKWTEIADVATVKALAIAGKAQETADGKIRNFITTAEHPTPYPPYDVGDLWNQGDNGDIMCCIVSRVSGNYVASDWVKSNKYTDDAVAIDARNKANEARASAESAKTSAEEANTAISDMSSDDIISPIEKQALKKEWDAIMSEKSLNDAQADKFNVSRTLYDGAYNDLATFIGGNLSNLTTNWNVSGATLRFTFKAYYDARTTLLNNIAYVAKQQADKAESDAANAQNAADNAMSGLVEANKQITSLDGKYTAQQSDITNLKTTVDAIPGKITQEVSGVIDWTKQYTQGEIGNIQFGMVNLLKGSNVELGAQGYLLGNYYYDKKPENGKRYTIVMCYTLGSNNTNILVYQDSYMQLAARFVTKGDKIIESKSFIFNPVRDSEDMGFYQSPEGIYGSKVHWAVLVEGNKGPSGWVPSLFDQEAQAKEIAAAEAALAETKANAYADGIVTEAEQNAINEAQARLDALKIGSVNLVSRKMMLAWNEKNKDIAVWGQDADGIYLAINQKLLYENVGGGTSRLDCFLGEGKYKANTQYVFQVEWKLAAAQSDGGLSFWVTYTDGTVDGIRLNKDQTSLTRDGFITAKGKTVIKIYSSYMVNTSRSLIYSLALYEGNKVLTEIPVATEDLQGQSNVNLLDNSKFQFGTEGYAPNQTASLNVVNGVLQVRSSQTTSSPGVRLPLVHLKPGVYTVKVNTKGVNIPSHSVSVYKGDMSSSIIGTGYIPVLSTFTEKLLTFAISTEGDYRVLMAWQSPTATAYPAGLDIEYSMLVEGFTPPASYSPSQGDVQKEIDDVNNAVINLGDTINGAFKDGIISEAEAKAIASNINILNAEKADIDAYYNKLYANAYLTGTAKTNLLNAKTAYNTAHEKLINSINTAIADGKTTATEKADVDAKFTTYNNALSAYQTRVGEADKAIQDQIKALAEQDATNKVDNIQIGARNLFLNSGSEVTNGSYLTKKYNTSVDILPSKKYTVVIRGTTTGGQKLGVWFNSGSDNGGYFPVNMNDEVAFIHVTSPASITESYKRQINFYNYPFSGSAANPATIKWACLYEGHVKPPLDWVQAPEDVEEKINEINSRLSEWASDGYISPQEKTALRQQKSDIQAEEKEIEANANRYGISLASYMSAYNAAISALTKYTATSPENIPVGSDYNNIAAYYTARQTILNSIAAAAKAQADKATGAIGMEGGMMLYKDPEFKVGRNGTTTYGAQNGGGTVVINRIRKSTGQDASNSFSAAMATHVKNEASGSPYSGSDWCLHIKAYGGTSPSHLGGFSFSNPSRANAVFIVKVSAKIPVGYTLKNAHNSHGTGSKQEFLTPMAGTGKYETYIFKETCGSTGTFSTVNHLYLSGPVKTGSDPLDENPDNRPLEWFVDYATVMDQTADGYGDIIDTVTTEFNTKIDQKADSVTVTAIRTDLNSLGQVVSQQGSKIDVNTGSIDMIVTKNGSGTIVSIKPEMVEITGATVIKDGNGNKVNIFGVGDKVISVNGGVFSVDKDGKVIMTNAEITGKVTSKTGEIGGMAITDNGIRSIDFNPVTMVGSCYARNGLSVYASGSGILIPSNGLLQASRITAIGDNASIIGMEIVAHNNSGYGSLASVTALKLSAKNESSTLVKRPVALYVDSGDIVINDGVFCVPVKSTSFYGTSMTFAPSAIIYGINTIGSDNVNVKIANGVSGQILTLMNYSGKRFNIVKSDGTLVTRVPAEKSVVLYFNGSNWTGLMIGDFYIT